MKLYLTATWEVDVPDNSGPAKIESLGQHMKEDPIGCITHMRTLENRFPVKVDVRSTP